MDQDYLDSAARSRARQAASTARAEERKDKRREARAGAAQTARLTEETARFVARVRSNPDAKRGTIQQILKDDPFWPEFRRIIYDRDDQTCQCCGRRNGEGVSVRTQHLRTPYEHPELAFDPSNVVLLCQGKDRCTTSAYLEARRNGTSFDLKVTVL